MVDKDVLDAATALKARGNEFFTKKRHSDAVDEYSRVIDSFAQKVPRDFINITLCNRAACYIELGRYTEAISDFNSLLENVEGTSSSTISKAFFRLARCHYEQGSYEEAKVQIDNYDKSLDSATISVNQPAVTSLKKSINDKRNEKRNAENRRQGQGDAPNAHPEQRLLPMTYQAVILGTGAEPFTIIKKEKVPASLCATPPPEIPIKKFLVSLVNKYYDENFQSRPRWECWDCHGPAVAMVNSPSSCLREVPPEVVDFIQPIYEVGGKCERNARAFIYEQLTAQLRGLG